MSLLFGAVDFGFAVLVWCCGFAGFLGLCGLCGVGIIQVWVYLLLVWGA